MALSVQLTINSVVYDVANYVMKDSIFIDESLFNDKDLKPTTNKASFTLSRDCPYIDELFAWADDVPITISLDGVPAFTGYLTDDHSLSIGTTGAKEVKIDAEDPGIRKLKVSWVSTDTLSTIFNGIKVCDPADITHSFVHILAALAGVNLATMPTISSPLYFTVKDSDSKDYWGVLTDVLFDNKHVFYFNPAGELALYSFATLTGTPTQAISTSAEVLAKNGDDGIKITKRLLTFKQVDVKFKEAETLAVATIYRDTTGQTAINDCNIELAGGAYYPSTCDASTYAFFDYFLEDGRKILSVGSATPDFVVDSGITAEYLNIGLSARVRFLNTLGITADIRKLKVAGTNVVAVKAESKVIAGESSKFKKEYEAKYITSKTAAAELANLLYFFYKNSSSTYKWRSYMGTLYPSATLFPETTLYPMGDLIALGEIVNLKDPLFTSLDVNTAVVKRKYRLGYYGADYEGVGIGTIILSNPIGYTPTVPAITPGPKYLATKPLVADPLGETPDIVDFDGQYGTYNGSTYIGTIQNTWTRITPKRYSDVEDTIARNALIGMIAGDIVYQLDTRQWYKYTTSWVTDGAAQLIPADVVTYAPKNLGRYEAAHPTAHNPGDFWTVFDTDDDPIQRGVWFDNLGTPTRISAVTGEIGYTTNVVLLAKLSSCMADVSWCEKNSYGTVSDYGIAVFFESFGAVMAFILNLFAQNITLGAAGFLKSHDYAESGGNPTAGFMLDVANQLIKAYGAKFVNATISGKATLAELVLSGVTAGNNKVRSSAETEVYTNNISFTLAKQVQIGAGGQYRTYFDLNLWADRYDYGFSATAAIFRNRDGSRTQVGTDRVKTTTEYEGYYEDISGWQEGDIVEVWYKVSNSTFARAYARAVVVYIAEQPGILKYIGNP